MEMPPPGWYADPAGPTGLLRWWDGSQWTSHTAPVPSGGPSGGHSGGPSDGQGAAAIDATPASAGTANAAPAAEAYSAPPAFGAPSAPSAPPAFGHDRGGEIEPALSGQASLGTGDDISLTDWFESIPVPVLSREEAALSREGGAMRGREEAAAPAAAGDWSPVSTGDQLPVPPAGWSPAPTADQAHGPAGGQTLTPAAGWSPVSTGDQLPVPAADWAPTPAGDQTPFPAAEFPAADWSPVSTGDQLPVPAADWAPAPAGDQAPAAPADWSPVSTGDQLPVPPADWSPAPTADQAPAPAGGNSTRRLELSGPAWNAGNAPWNQDGATWAGQNPGGVLVRPGRPPAPPKPRGWNWAERWDAALTWANQNRTKVMWGLGLGTAVAVLAVAGLVILLSSSAPAPATPNTGATHPAAASKVSASPSASATGAPSTTPTTGTPVTDSTSGLSYAMLGSPWQGGCPTLLNNSTFTWSTGESAVAGTVGSGVNSAWYASACSGLLGSQYSYTGVADLENTADSLVGAFDPAYYNGLPHSRTTVENDPLQVSGHPAWVMKFLMTYPTAASQGLAWQTELGAVVVVDRGTGQPPGVFYVAVPDNLGAGNVDTELQSLQMSAPPTATTPPASPSPSAPAGSPPGANP